MLKVSIPGYRDLALAHLVLDYNGTLGCEGHMLEGVRERLGALADEVEIHVLTADTFGHAEEELAGAPCKVSVLPRDDQDVGKLEYIRGLGPGTVACVGNGRNDRMMLKEAALGIVVIQAEGAAAEAVAEADVVCRDIHEALDLLLHPLRLIATLRS